MPENQRYSVRVIAKWGRRARQRRDKEKTEGELNGIRTVQFGVSFSSRHSGEFERANDGRAGECHALLSTQ